MASTEGVWDDEQPEQLNKDTKIHLSHLFQDGFRTGVAQGQEQKVQEGFDNGYEQGMHEGIAWGTSQGVLTMYQALKSKIDDPDVCHKLEKAVETAKGISASDAYVHSYNKLAASKETELKTTKECTVFPERLKQGKDIHEKILDIETRVKSCGM